MASIALLLFTIGVAQAVSDATTAQVQPLFWVHGVNLSAAVDPHTGYVTQLNTSSGWRRTVQARSWVTDDPRGQMDQVSLAVTPLASGGGVVVTRVVSVKGYGDAAMQGFNATLTDTFAASPDPVVGGILWTLHVTTASMRPWRAAVATEITFAAGQPPQQFWLPHNGHSMAEDVLRCRNGSEPGYATELGQGYVYGGGACHGCMPYPLFLWAGAAAGDEDAAAAVAAAAAAAPLGGDGGGGLIVAPRLNDTTLAARAALNSTSLLFTRLYNRQSAGRVWSWSTHLGALRPPDPAAVDPRLPVSVRSDAPWRDALRFAMDVSPAVFHSVVPAVEPLSSQPTSVAKVGMGVYTCAPPSSINLSTTVELAGATTLWDASFWWPYIGMFLPPVPDAVAQWKSNQGGSEQQSCSGRPGGFKHGQLVSAATVSNHLIQAAENGLSVPLSYFNLFEFGQNVRWPLPPGVPGCNATDHGSIQPAACWNDSSIFLASQLADAVLFTGSDRKPQYTWQRAVVLDPGVKSYRSFLVSQAQRHVRLLGSSFKGIVIDRTDHTTAFSKARDDNISWCGAPCASMLLAWLASSRDVSAVMHNCSAPGTKAFGPPIVLINYAGSARAELLRHADGVFSESGDALLNTLGLSTLAMPAIGWTYQSHGNGTINDSYMQRHLRMGVQPMAPVYGADHSLGDQDEQIDELFRDYGPLFRAIRSVRWGLDRSHVIRIDPPPHLGGPLENVFASLDPRSSPAPWVVVLALASPHVDSALVTLKLPFGSKPAGCQVLLPGMGGRTEGAERAHVVHRTRVGQEILLQLRARLERGCAVLQCSLE